MVLREREQFHPGDQPLPGVGSWRGEGYGKNRKGRDIGYALVTSSCEGANNVEACTVTTPDAITAFAVPNPNCSSQNQSAFSGPAAARVASFSESLSLLRISNCLFLLTLSTVDDVKLTRPGEMSTPGNCAIKISSSWICGNLTRCCIHVYLARRSSGPVLHNPSTSAKRRHRRTNQRS